MEIATTETGSGIADTEDGVSGQDDECGGNGRQQERLNAGHGIFPFFRWQNYLAANAALGYSPDWGFGRQYLCWGHVR